MRRESTLYVSLPLSRKVTRLLKVTGSEQVMGGDRYWFQRVDEYCVRMQGPLGVNQASDIDVGLLLARKITQHINVLGSEAWLTWQAAQSINRFWGPLRLSWKVPLNAIYVTRQYYTFLHYTKFVRPGVYPLLVSSKCLQTVLAVYDWRVPRVVVNVVNQRFRKKYIRIALQGFTCTFKGRCLVDVYRTSATESFRLLGRGLPSCVLIRQAVAPYSLTTYIIRGAKPKGVFKGPQNTAGTVEPAFLGLLPRKRPVCKIPK